LAIEVASEQYSKKKKKVAHNSKELVGNMKSPHDNMIDENATTAGMEDKETAVNKKREVKLRGVISKDEATSESSAMNKAVISLAGRQIRECTDDQGIAGKLNFTKKMYFFSPKVFEFFKLIFCLIF
jgi:hypothetical protein